MNRLTNSPGYARVRGGFGLAFIIIGVITGYQLVAKYGIGLNTLSGIVLSLAMIALGVVRIKGAFATVQRPK